MLIHFDLEIFKYNGFHLLEPLILVCLQDIHKLHSQVEKIILKGSFDRIVYHLEQGDIYLIELLSSRLKLYLMARLNVGVTLFFVSKERKSLSYSSYPSPSCEARNS